MGNESDATNWRNWTRAACFLGALACSGCPSGGAPKSPPGGASRGGSAATQPASGGDHYIAAAFDAARAQYGDLTYPDLIARLGLRRSPDSAPTFDPTRVAFYDRVRGSLQLTPDEEATYRRTGVVGVDHGQRYSMGSMYYAIYTRDLPVLVTTDSILHAMHRTFDGILMYVEMNELAPKMQGALEAAHAALAADVSAAGAAGETPLLSSLRDVDLYLTVARNLLIGSSAPEPWPPGQSQPTGGGAEIYGGALKVHSLAGQDDAVVQILQKIAAATAEEFAVYGGQRPVDWSQFVPRGHYTKHVMLRRYFRAMMWLGRADLGFYLSSPPAGSSLLRPDVTRETRDAALLSGLLARSGQLGPLGDVSRTIDYLVGAADNATPDDVAAALASAGLKEASDLGDPAAISRLQDELRKSGVGGQRIRSQIIDTPFRTGPETRVPDVFQLFGQRFVLDSFLLSKVVFDAILFHGEKQERMMPSGLDVMAALGSGEAPFLLQPDLERFHYAANLLAARDVVRARPAESWSASVYDQWLGALPAVASPPPAGHFPEVMRGRAWQDKELETQLASWAELRHDTILYAKQSYTVSTACEYPAGFVEPYPDLYARAARFAEETKRRLEAAHVEPQGVGDFLDRFATTVRKLERLASKELAAQPFDDDEKRFLKATIDVRGGGSGGPRYDGWYPSLIYGDPASWTPTIADVHTDPNGGAVLEVGVGDVDFVVVAIDNAGDRAAYVGPISSYYEFTSPQRLTDEEWEGKLRSAQPPAHPGWTRSFQSPAVVRSLAQAPRR
jgi:hypothetical protein